MTQPIEPNARVATPSTWPAVKVARAAQHLLALQGSIGLWMATKPFDTEVAISDDRLLWTARLRVTSPPPLMEWSAFVGDCVHNLRSALDAVVWDLATRDGRSPAKPNLIAFPICSTGGDWKNQSAPKLDGVPSEELERIRLLQPFQRPDTERASDALVILQRLDNDDKHRSQIIAGVDWQKIDHQLAVAFVDPEAAERNTPPDTTVHVPAFVDGALLMEYRTLDPMATVEGEFQFGARLKIETPIGDQPLLETLGSLIMYVNSVISVVYGAGANHAAGANGEPEGGSSL